jgi:nucleoside permease NupC
VAIVFGAISSLSGVTIEKIRKPCWKAFLIGVLTSLFNASVAGIININSNLESETIYNSTDSF